MVRRKCFGILDDGQGEGWGKKWLGRFRSFIRGEGCPLRLRSGLWPSAIGRNDGRLRGAADFTRGLYRRIARHRRHRKSKASALINMMTRICGSDSGRSACATRSPTSAKQKRRTGEAGVLSQSFRSTISKPYETEPQRGSSARAQPKRRCLFFLPARQESGPKLGGCKHQSDSFADVCGKGPRLPG